MKASNIGETPSSSKTGAQILQVAEQLFSSKGYEGTSLREIAEKTGIKQPSLYAHYANKEAIYHGVIDKALEPFIELMSSWEGKELSFKEMMGIPNTLVNLHAKQPYSAQILHSELMKPADEISEKIINWFETISFSSESFIRNIAPSSDTSPEEYKKQTVIMLITFTNITLGMYSTRGIQTQLLGDEVCENEINQAHEKVLFKIFKSLLL